ncbi:Rha family transcriptional regulator [Breoghania sp.]|uniref:Rha family transcriptional regulator n=1 Tax=Breoghania sp. TaxID=2065378 RepID=UPI00261AB9DC|nr:Rha family transcriptional regulator [Breoghania sp.]MDJ0933542.1 Rha family transcriptional regulator [Breoghania sp.]
MFSREIAELTGKLHHHVCRDIRAMLGELGESETKFGFCYTADTGNAYTEYLLPKRECLGLVSGYSARLRMAIIDRWQELEAQAALTPALPNFSDEIGVAEAWVAAKKEARAAEAQILIAEGQVQAFLPDARVGKLAVSHKRTITEFARLLPGVNLQRIKLDFAELGYLYRTGCYGTWRVYRRHNKLFEERLVDDAKGYRQIIATDELSTVVKFII